MLYLKFKILQQKSFSDLASFLLNNTNPTYVLYLCNRTRFDSIFSSECRSQLKTRLCMNLFACCLAYMYFIVKAVEEGEVIIKDSLEQCDNPNHATVTCTAGML